jgi:hypothetical protein
MMLLSKLIESPPNKITIPPSPTASFPVIEQLTKRVGPFGIYTPFLPRDLFPEIVQFMKVELVTPVLKYANPPLDEPLEFASLPMIRIFVKDKATAPWA